MKNILTALSLASLLFSCGPSQEQIDAMNKKRTDSLDSIARVEEEMELEMMMAANDSIDKARADSILKAQADSARIEDSLKKVKKKKPVTKDAPKK